MLLAEPQSSPPILVISARGDKYALNLSAQINWSRCSGAFCSPSPKRKAVLNQQQ